MKTFVLVWVLVFVHRDAKDGVLYSQELGRPFSQQALCDVTRVEISKKIKMLPEDKLECRPRYVEGQVVTK